MSAVITGLAQCFHLEDAPCKLSSVYTVSTIHAYTGSTIHAYTGQSSITEWCHCVPYRC